MGGCSSKVSPDQGELPHAPEFGICRPLLCVPPTVSYTGLLLLRHLPLEIEYPVLFLGKL